MEIVPLQIFPNKISSLHARASCQAVCFWDAGTVAWHHGLTGPFETSVYLNVIRMY